ncbi:dihydrofolate reductase family protein [Flavobacterium sp. 3-210]
MKVNVIANISINGQVLLAGKPDHQVPEQALGYFIQYINEVKSVVLGSATYDVLESFPGGAKGVFPGVEIVILSGQKHNNIQHKVAVTPQEALNYLSSKGFTETVLGGGAKTYNAFLNSGLVTDIYFNFIPITIGDGGVIGNQDSDTRKFKLVENKMLTSEILQVHYSAV